MTMEMTSFRLLRPLLLLFKLLLSCGRMNVDRHLLRRTRRTLCRISLCCVPHVMTQRENRLTFQREPLQLFQREHLLLLQREHSQHHCHLPPGRLIVA
jgi:hypothetical protein